MRLRLVELDEWFKLGPAGRGWRIEPDGKDAHPVGARELDGDSFDCSTLEQPVGPRA